MARAEGGGSGGGHEEHALSDMGMGTFTLALTLGILARVWISKYIKLPYTVIVLILGLLVGLGVTADLAASSEDIFTRSIARWINLSPEAILFTILPLLIFETSFSSDLHLFMKQIVPVLILAVPAVLWNTATIGLTARYVLPYNWDWPTSLMFGGMMSATDPVAVVAILKELGIAESLSVLIEGESLLNDGTAIVVFTIFSTPVTKGTTLTVTETVSNIASLCLGGPIIGVLVGAASSYVVGFILNDPPSEITATVITCYGAYVLAESTGLHASGVLSIVCAGLYLSFYGLGRISARVVASLRSFWQMAGYITNTLIFFISGLIMAEKALVSKSVQERDWGFMVLLYLLVNVSRALATVIFYPSLSRGAYGIDWKQGVVLSWAGLRGAVSLTLSLAVHQQSAIPEATRDRILFLTAGVVLLTITINGTTAKPLINRLGLNKASWAEKEMFVRATSLIESRIESAAREFQRNKYLGDADWAIVWRYIPVPSAEVYWHRVQKGNVVLSRDEINVIGQHVESGGLSSGRSSLRRRHGLHFIKFEHLPPRLRSRWRRYLAEYNDLADSQAEGLRAIRADIYAAAHTKAVLREDGEYTSSSSKAGGSSQQQQSAQGEGGAGKAGGQQHLRHHSSGAGGPSADKKKEEGEGGASTPTPGGMVIGMRRLSTLGGASLFTPQLSRQNSFTRQLGMTKTPLDFEPFQANYGSSLPEARLRLLTVLKHVYWGCFQNGLLSPTGLRAFEKNVALLVADTSGPLDEWGTLEKNLLFPLRALQSARRWRRLPVVGSLVETFLFARLAFLFEVAVVFIEAHSNVKMEDLFGSGIIARTLALEVTQEIRNAKATLKEFLPVFPDIFNSVKTEIAARFVLHRYRSLLEAAFEEGSLNAREFDECIKECDSSMVKLYDHVHAEAATPLMDVLTSVPFLRFLSQDRLQSLFASSHSTLCRDFFLRSGRSFLREGGDDQMLLGWYVVVRGSVVCGDDDNALPSGAVLGLCECLLGTPVRRTYTTTSLTHLVFFDKAAMLSAAARSPALLRSLWWYVAAHELRRMEGFQHLTYAQLGSVLTEDRFIYVPTGHSRQKTQASTSTMRGLLTRRLTDRQIPTALSMTSINAAPSQGGAASGGSIGGVYGSLGTSSSTSAAAVDEQSLRIEGDGMAHLLVLTGGIDAAPALKPTTDGSSAVSDLGLSAVAFPPATSPPSVPAESETPSSGEDPYIARNFEGSFRLRPGTVAFLIPVSSVPPPPPREAAELPPHQEERDGDLDDIEAAILVDDDDSASSDDGEEEALGGSRQAAKGPMTRSSRGSKGRADEDDDYEDDFGQMPGGEARKAAAGGGSMNKSELTEMMKKSLAALFSPLNSAGGSGAGTNSPAGAPGTENRCRPSPEGSPRGPDPGV